MSDFLSDVKFLLADVELKDVLNDVIPALAVDLETKRIVLANARAEELFDTNAMVGKRISDFIPERFRSRHDQHLDGFAVSDGSRLMTNRQLRGLRADGVEISLLILLSSAEIQSRKCGIAMMVPLPENEE
jgi:PAS domain-containing protein